MAAGESPQPAHHLDHHRAAGPVVDGLAREDPRAVQGHAGARERGEVADAHAERLRLLAARGADVDVELVDRDRLLRLVGRQDVGRLRAGDAVDRSLRAVDREILVDDHAGVVESDRGDADEALVLDVLDDEPELVHVRAEHHGGPAVAAAAGEVVVSERIGLVLVVVSGELGGDDVGDRRSSPETPMAASRAASRSSILSDNGTSSRGPKPTVPPVRLELPPAPYDFHRSTFRYRTFGDDAASVWHDGGLYRVLRSGLVVRISADGVEASRAPAAADHAEVLHILGASFDLPSFEAALSGGSSRGPPGSGRRSRPTRSSRSSSR